MRPVANMALADKNVARIGLRAQFVGLEQRKNIA